MPVLEAILHLEENMSELSNCIKAVTTTATQLKTYSDRLKKAQSEYDQARELFRVTMESLRDLVVSQ
jgi:outer membrane protein TolC